MLATTNATPVILIVALALLATGLALVTVYYSHKARELRRQRVRLERQVAKTEEALKAKINYFSRMSHEIRTPMNAIIGMVQIAQGGIKQADVDECLRKIDYSSKHLLGIINDILDFSKIESNNFELECQWFSLKKNIDFVKSMIQVRAQEKGVNLTFRLTSLQHDGIETDALRLNQVLINLLSNAVKFTDPGGMISLEVEEVAHIGEESMYRFIVEDTGVGMEPEQTKRLFTPFTQANAGISRVYGGTGLGLVISQQIVRCMGGDIAVETEYGKGSVFQFTIRVPSQPDAPEEKIEESVQEVDLSRMRMLVVDDIEINREIIIGMLGGSGVTIDQAVNGQQAVDLFCASSIAYYDVILMDMQMPVLDGCAATRIIRGSGREDAAGVRILAMTANVFQEDINAALAAGMDNYLIKPVEISTLNRKLVETL